MLTAFAVRELLLPLDDPDDGELLKSRDLLLHLLDHTDNPFSRGQFAPGHITCTGLVLAPDGGAALLVHHRRLARWLLPGGHVELIDATLADAARREVLEETGAELHEGSARLIGIDVHGIPPGKGEPYHLHHDLLFAFRARSRDIRVSEESHAVAWRSLDDLADLPRNVTRAVIRLTA